MSDQDRLLALQATELLDTLPEERFDRLTRLAANTLGAEIALISLVDENRQWFKSSHGLSETETSRETSFCHHAIMQDDIMVVGDATKDARFKENPLVCGSPDIRFYAGAPLITKEGFALGTLCIIDTKTRKDFTAQDRQILSDLASTVMTEIENVRQSQVIDDLSLVNDELRHRMGNMYAHVSALVSLMGRDEQDKDRLVKRIREKINMLAATQSLLARHKWTSVPLSALIETTLSPFISSQNRDRVKFQTQPDMDVSPRGAFILSLMLNELGANAVKHGALGIENGDVSLTWKNDDDENITFVWQEHLKELRKPSESGTGFGSQILKKIVPMDIQGVAEHHITETGLLYRVSGKTSRIFHFPA